MGVPGNAGPYIPTIYNQNLANVGKYTSPMDCMACIMIVSLMKNGVL